MFCHQELNKEIDNTTTTLRQQNEQALVLKVCDLKDGDSRAAYKTSDLDVRAYKRIKMFMYMLRERMTISMMVIYHVLLD